MSEHEHADEPDARETERNMTTDKNIPAGTPEASAPEMYFYSETIKHQISKRRHSRFVRRLAAVSLISILACGVLGTALGIAVPLARESFARDAETAALSEGPAAAEAEEEAAVDPNTPHSIWIDIVNALEPSVARINTTGTQVMQGFGFSRSMPIESGGSGIVFHEDRDLVYIATNNHVVAGMETVSVSLSGCEPVPAKLTGSDPAEDISVICVEKAALQAAGVSRVAIAAFGDSDGVRVGETVVAIGNALGEGNIATLGIVSANNKEMNIDGRELTVVQTDAAINSGNSGGPLVNMNGEVVGINTAKVSSSYVEGMGFSITANAAKPIIEALMGRVTKPFLGISGYDMNEERAAQLGLPPIGVYIESVVEGGSAEAAGIRRTDVITGFNGAPVMNFEQLTGEISKCKVGDTVDVNIIRDSKTPMVVKVKLAEYMVNGQF